MPHLHWLDLALTNCDPVVIPKVWGCAQLPEIPFHQSPTVLNSLWFPRWQSIVTVHHTVRTSRAPPDLAPSILILSE